MNEWGHIFLDIALLSPLYTTAGLPAVREKSGKIFIFQGQGKVREFCEKSGKIFEWRKVMEKSGNFFLPSCWQPCTGSVVKFVNSLFSLTFAYVKLSSEFDMLSIWLKWTSTTYFLHMNAVHLWSAKRLQDVLSAILKNVVFLLKMYSKPPHSQFFPNFNNRHHGLPVSAGYGVSFLLKASFGLRILSLPAPVLCVRTSVRRDGRTCVSSFVCAITHHCFSQDHQIRIPGNPFKPFLTFFLGWNLFFPNLCESLF